MRNAPNELHRGINRLRSRIDKVDSVQRFRQQREQPVSSHVLCGLTHFAINHYVQVLIDLFVDGAEDVGMAMTKRAGADPRDEIDDFLPVFQRQPGALCMLNPQSEWMQGGLRQSVPQQFFVHGRLIWRDTSSTNTQLGFPAPRCPSGSSPWFSTSKRT